MTGTVWDPVIMGTPMRLHKHVLVFLEKYKICMWSVITCRGYRLYDYNYTSHALVLASWRTKENECQ